MTVIVLNLFVMVIASTITYHVPIECWLVGWLCECVCVPRAPACV